MRAAINASPKVTLGAQLLNGWNNGSEINQEQNHRPQRHHQAHRQVHSVQNYMFGKGTRQARTTRNLFDTTLTLAVSPKFSLMGNFDYGKESDVSWWGIAAYAKLQARPNWAVVGRYEYLDDSEGGVETAVEGEIEIPEPTQQLYGKVEQRKGRGRLPGGCLYGQLVQQLRGGYHDLDVGNVTGRVVTGLSQGTTYYYRVRPYNATGPGDYSEAMAVTTVATTGLNINATFDSSITGNRTRRPSRR